MDEQQAKMSQTQKFQAARTKWWHDPRHPIWTIATIAVVLMGAGLLSWVNASSFDEDEYTFLIQLVGWTVGGGAGIGLLANKLGVGNKK